MNYIKEDLETRKQEIIEFLNLIRFLEDTKKITSIEGQDHSINIRLICTLKANIFLLLYNLIESTMRESINYIHEKIDAKEVLFNELRDELRKEILRRVKSKNISLDNLCKNIATNISTQILTASFKDSYIFSANIDHQEICKQAKIYGFDTQTDYKDTAHGEPLEKIKRNRNDLAHGNASFSKVGEAYTYQDLNILTTQTIKYLEKIIEHISSYINRQAYLVI